MSILTRHLADKSGSINVKIVRLKVEAYAV